MRDSSSLRQSPLPWVQRLARHCTRAIPFLLIFTLAPPLAQAKDEPISSATQPITPAADVVAGIQAEERLGADAAAGRRIESISIHNPTGRTRQSYVRAKLGLTEGDVLTQAALAAGLQTLRNIRIFREVSADLFQGKSPDAVHIDLQLDEKWTTLPDLRFGGGGGTAFFRFGVYDINWLGLGVEGLLSYENRNGTHNGDAWFRWPNALETQNLFGLGMRRKTEILNAYDDSHVVLGGEAMVKTTLLLDYERPLTDLVVFGYRMEPEWVEFNTDLVSDEARRANATSGRMPSAPTRRILHRTQLQIGRINYIGVRAEGIDLQTQWLPAFAGFGTDRDLLITSHQLRIFWMLPIDSYLAARAVYATSSSGRTEDLQRLGGLNEVRGYRDLEFAGRHVAYANVEYRQNLFRTWSLVWQPAVFFDTGWTADTPDQLTSARARDAAGLGMRIIPEFVHLVAVRLDYAFALSDPHNGGGISFGMLQLF